LRPSPLLPTSAAELRVERVQALRPERPVAAEPGVELGQRGRLERVDAPARLGPRANQPVLAQDAEVSRHRRLADREVRADLRRVVVTLGQQLDDAAARGSASAASASMNNIYSTFVI
jgi:hypothetical protein